MAELVFIYAQKRRDEILMTDNPDSSDNLIKD